MKCKKCGSEEYRKNGIVRESRTQRYQCKACGFNYTNTPARGVPMSVKLAALQLYASGLSLNKIGKLLKIFTPAVLKWIRALGKDLCHKIEPQGSVVIVELDEMWHYIKKNRKDSGSGKLLILLQVDSSTGSLEVATAAH